MGELKEAAASSPAGEHRGGPPGAACPEVRGGWRDPLAHPPELLPKGQAHVLGEQSVVLTSTGSVAVPLTAGSAQPEHVAQQQIMADDSEMEKRDFE